MTKRTPRPVYTEKQIRNEIEKSVDTMHAYEIVDWILETTLARDRAISLNKELVEALKAVLNTPAMNADEMSKEETKACHKVYKALEKAEAR